MYITNKQMIYLPDNSPRMIYLTENSPKYKLIKEYPDSEPLGTIFQPLIGQFHYRTVGKMNSAWSYEYFESWVGEYFQIVK